LVVVVVVVVDEQPKKKKKNKKQPFNFWRQTNYRHNGEPKSITDIATSERYIYGFNDGQ